MIVQIKINWNLHSVIQEIVRFSNLFHLIGKDQLSIKHIYFNDNRKRCNKASNLNAFWYYSVRGLWKQDILENWLNDCQVEKEDASSSFQNEPHYLQNDYSEVAFQCILYALLEKYTEGIK